MERKGQGAIEYLLIIGAAILVVAIVILAVTGVLGGAKNSSLTTQNDYNNSLFESKCINDVTAMGSNTAKATDCNTTTGQITGCKCCKPDNNAWTASSITGCKS